VVSGLMLLLIIALIMVIVYLTKNEEESDYTVLESEYSASTL
jgi:hypothetical protein